MFGKAGTKEGEFLVPAGIYIDGERIFVSDQLNRRKKNSGLSGKGEMKRLLAPLFLALFAWAEGWLEVVPERVEFGTVEEGKLSKPKKIQIKNIHTKDIVFGSVNIAGRDFLDFRIGKDLCSYTILKPGATCEVEILFQPRPLPKKEGFSSYPFPNFPTWTGL